MARTVKGIKLDKNIDDFLTTYMERHPEFGYRSTTHLIEEILRGWMRTVQESENK